MPANENLVLALPKGRILKEVVPILRRAGIEPEPAFDDEASRALQFATSVPELSIIRVRSFDVATFVAFGAAHMGVAGNDVLMEFNYPELFAPVDLGIGKCRLSVAEPREMRRVFNMGAAVVMIARPDRAAQIEQALGEQLIRIGELRRG